MADRFDLAPYLSYRIGPDQLDQMPLGTFFASKSSANSNAPRMVVRLVQAKPERKYPHSSITLERRLLHYFWGEVRGAKKQLAQAMIEASWHWIVQPGDPGFEELAAFKILCDLRVGSKVPVTRLYQALGIDLSPDAASITE